MFLGGPAKYAHASISEYFISPPLWCLALMSSPLFFPQNWKEQFFSSFPPFETSMKCTAFEKDRWLLRVSAHKIGPSNLHIGCWTFRLKEILINFTIDWCSRGVMRWGKDFVTMLSMNDNGRWMNEYVKRWWMIVSELNSGMIHTIWMSEYNELT